VWVRGMAWTLDLPEVLPSTMEIDGIGCGLSRVELLFCVSSDEEHVELTVVRPEGAANLGARAHHYLLLTLARARLEYEARGADTSPAVWWRYREDLMRMLRLEPSSLNVAIHRARKRFDDLGIRGAAGSIERRRGSGLVRLAAVGVRVEAL
jgi:hypothetical protein